MQHVFFSGPGELEWREALDPRLVDDRDVLVRPLAVARCDLDPAIAIGPYAMPAPFAMGHEMVGEVVDRGGDVEICDRVIVPFQVSCGTVPGVAAGSPTPAGPCQQARRPGWDPTAASTSEARSPTRSGCCTPTTSSCHFRPESPRSPRPASPTAWLMGTVASPARWPTGHASRSWSAAWRSPSSSTPSPPRSLSVDRWSRRGSRSRRLHRRIRRLDRRYHRRIRNPDATHHSPISAAR